MRTGIGLCGALGLLLLGCGGDDEGPAGRGSAACNDFQDALCDFGADRCRVLDRADCDDSLRGIECASDSAASACANALNGATCGMAAPECNLGSIVDAAPAVSRCNRLIELICERGMRCGQFASIEACRMQSLAMVGLDCKDAVSASLRYEECEQQIKELSCTGPAPSVCRGVIGVLPNFGM